MTDQPTYMNTQSDRPVLRIKAPTLNSMLTERDERIRALEQENARLARRLAKSGLIDAYRAGWEDGREAAAGECDAHSAFADEKEAYWRGQGDSSSADWWRQVSETVSEMSDRIRDGLTPPDPPTASQRAAQAHVSLKPSPKGRGWFAEAMDQAKDMMRDSVMLAVSDAIRKAPRSATESAAERPSTPETPRTTEDGLTAALRAPAWNAREPVAEPMNEDGIPDRVFTRPAAPMRVSRMAPDDVEWVRADLEAEAERRGYLRGLEAAAMECEREAEDVRLDADYFAASGLLRVLAFDIRALKTKPEQEDA